MDGKPHAGGVEVPTLDDEILKEVAAVIASTEIKSIVELVWMVVMTRACVAFSEKSIKITMDMDDEE